MVEKIAGIVSEEINRVFYVMLDKYRTGTYEVKEQKLSIVHGSFSDHPYVYGYGTSGLQETDRHLGPEELVKWTQE